MSIPVSAGLAIIWDNKILLVHPTGQPEVGTYSIPKGIVENESFLDCAIRETAEEVGLVVSIDQIDKTEHVVLYKTNKGEVRKRVIYYYVHLTDAPDICDENAKIPQKYLQLEEINKARFFTREQAKNIIFWRMIPILDVLT